VPERSLAPTIDTAATLEAMSVASAWVKVVSKRWAIEITSEWGSGSVTQTVLVCKGYAGTFSLLTHSDALPTHPPTTLHNTPSPTGRPETIISVHMQAIDISEGPPLLYRLPAPG
jgi:hypothetical protein